MTEAPTLAGGYRWLRCPPSASNALEGRPIVNDNPLLSLSTAGRRDLALAAPDPANPASEVAPARGLADYLSASVADNSRRAYLSDLRAFSRWGGLLPASPEIVTAYLVDNAARLSPVTLHRRVVAIGWAHHMSGYLNPCRTELVRTTLQGIRRVHGRPQRRVQPALREDVLTMLPYMIGTRGIRDRALILIGFAGAFRRSELVSLRYEDLSFVKEGATLLLRKSKTDQLGHGRLVAVPYARSQACPVRALEAWLEHSGIEAGPLFRCVSKAGLIGKQPLSPQTVAALVKKYAAKAGLDAANFSGHSLRSGLITSAAKAGVSSWKIREQTGHRSEATLNRYIRDARIFEGNAAGSVL